MKYLSNRNLCPSSKASHQKCYDELGEYLMAHRLKYSDEASDQWLISGYSALLIHTKHLMGDPPALQESNGSFTILKNRDYFPGQPGVRRRLGTE